MSIFRLPDLGEGLTDAEIREWHVKEGDTVELDQPLVAVETDKAVVDVSSPQAGRIARLHGRPGDVVAVGETLVEFDGAGAAGRAAAAAASAAGQAPEAVAPSTGPMATPSVRALAGRLNVDLTMVTPSGPDGTITAADVERVHKILAEVGPLEKLRGARRTMAQSMALSRDEAVPATITDDAVLYAWSGRQDFTVRLIRGLVAGVRTEPALNAWYDPVEIGRRVLDKIHVGIAVDTPQGLFVAVLQDVAGRSEQSLRAGLQTMKQDTANGTVPPEELRGYTIALSNFGRFGGKYATPVIAPPTVAIVAAGAARDAVVPIDGLIKLSRVLPLSVTFDHRCVTGGEAARFLAAMIADLEKPD